MKAFAALLVVVLILLTGCKQPLPGTEALTDGVGAAALAAKPTGGLLYANETGQVFDVGADGQRSAATVASVSVGSVSGSGSVLGLALDGQDRAFLSYVNSDEHLVVSQVAPGPERVIWKGPLVKGPLLGGALAFTPSGRLLVSVGSVASALDTTSYEGTLITLDVAADADQRPNVVSAGWRAPEAVTYSGGGSLWVAGLVEENAARLVRADTDGPTGTAADLGNQAPLGLTVFGDQELVACSGDGSLRRFLIQNAAATPGRLVAEDCSGGVVELQDRRLAYISDGSIRVTGQ